MNDLKKIEKDSNIIEKNRLDNFIESNQKLISVLGIFTALTVFTANLQFKAFGYALSFIFMSITLIIWIEVLEKFPKGNAHWRLKIFETLLSFSFFGLILYWLLSYREIWHQIMFFPLTIILTTLLISIFTYPIKKYDLFNRFFKTKPGKLKIIRHLLFLIIVIFFFYVSFWLATLISPPVNSLLDQMREEITKWIPKS
ncbi:MAG: hypothetical protein IPJ03_02750 [Ignavibacteriales bacterium]|nr:hypothetical protein [Ignavibacteriales bacterium]